MTLIMSGAHARGSGGQTVTRLSRDFSFWYTRDVLVHAKKVKGEAAGVPFLAPSLSPTLPPICPPTYRFSHPFPSCAIHAQVLLDYGPRSNAELITTHGFAVAHNPHETVPITLAPRGEQERRPYPSSLSLLQPILPQPVHV